MNKTGPLEGQGLRQGGGPGGSQVNQLSVSAVVPTFNSARTLEQCLASIRSNRTRYKYEVIVVDAGSNDATLETARRYADKVLMASSNAPRINRQQGVDNSLGEVICFTDSDCVVPEDWIEKLVDGLLRLNHQDPQVVGVGGGNVPLLENPSFMEKAIAKAMRSPLVSFRARNTALYRRQCQVRHNPPLNSALFKWAIQMVGGFDEEQGYGGEDMALDAKLVGRGFKLYYLPEVLVYHRHRANFKAFVWQMYKLGRASVRIRRKFKGYLPLFYHGPTLLFLMSFTPFIVIPLGMALLNASYVCLRERTPLLFFHLTLLTMSFYISYGLGRVSYMLRGEKR